MKSRLLIISKKHFEIDGEKLDLRIQIQSKYNSILRNEYCFELMKLCSVATKGKKQVDVQ